MLISPLLTEIGKPKPTIFLQLLCRFKTVSLELSLDAVSLEQIFLISFPQLFWATSGRIHPPQRSCVWHMMEEKDLFLRTSIHLNLLLDFRSKHILWETQPIRFLSLDTGLLPLLLGNPSKSILHKHCSVQRGHINKKTPQPQQQLLLKMKCKVLGTHCYCVWWWDPGCTPRFQTHPGTHFQLQNPQITLTELLLGFCPNHTSPSPPTTIPSHLCPHPH